MQHQRTGLLTLLLKINILRTVLVEERKTLVDVLCSDGFLYEWRHCLRDALTKLQQQRGALPQVLEDELRALEQTGTRIDLQSISRDSSRNTQQLKESLEWATETLNLARATLESFLKGSKK